MTKRHFYYEPRHIALLNLERDKYIPNKRYQREFVWSLKDKQYFIDSIIQNYPISQVYIRKMPEGIFEIVDGQQRLKTLWDFLQDQFPLSKEFSGSELHGRKYSKLPTKLKIEFDARSIPIMWLDNYNDEDVRSLFRRLQAGKDLNTAEKLNAFPGSITEIARDLADHNIFKNVNFLMDRYRSLHLSAQALLITNEGITDIGATYLYGFFKVHKDAIHTSKFFKKSKSILNFMNKLIKDEKLPEMRKPSWFINFFVFTKHILENYVVIGMEKLIYDFYKKFYHYIQKNKRLAKESRESGVSIDIEAIQFVNNNRAGTNNRKSIQSRCDFMVSKFLEWSPNIELKDKQRQFDDYQRIAIYRRDNGICQECKKHVPYKDYHADHVIPHSRGGATVVNNGQVLCSSCNSRKSNNPI